MYEEQKSNLQTNNKSDNNNKILQPFFINRFYYLINKTN